MLTIEFRAHDGKLQFRQRWLTEVSVQLYDDEDGGRWEDLLRLGEFGEWVDVPTGSGKSFDESFQLIPRVEWLERIKDMERNNTTLTGD